MQLTKIVCTLGPSTGTKEGIQMLASKGMTVARINMSHSTQEKHRETIHLLKEINTERLKEGQSPIGIMLDTKGAEIRTGDVETPIMIEANQEVVFSSQPLPDEKRQVIIVKHDLFAKDVQKAESILLDNGESNFQLVSILPNGAVVAKAEESAKIGSRRHVNLPGADLSIPALTDKDWEDMAFAAEEQVDFIALSFIREAKEVEEVRAFFEKKKVSIDLIAKIETRQSVANIDEIIRVSDGIMVARGDLGAEVPFERLPVIQDKLVASCKEAGKPVIVATHMLESMIQNPMPTRAEVTDIAHAATTSTDCTMLSGETANGKHPFKAIEAMGRVLRETERHQAEAVPQEQQPIRNEREAQAEAAVTLAVATKAAAIVVMTKSGRTARDVCRYRSRMPIIAFTDSESAQRKLQLSYAVRPYLLPFDAKPEDTVAAALKRVEELKLLKKGDRIVMISDAKEHDVTVSTIQMRTL